MTDKQKCKVTINGHRELNWIVSLGFQKKIYKIFNSLLNPQLDSGKKNTSTSESTSQIIISDNQGDGVTCFGTLVIKKKGNVYESKHDPELIIKNELLKTIPEEKNKEILPLIQSF